MTLLSRSPSRGRDQRHESGPPAVHARRRAVSRAGIAIDLLPGESLEETYAAIVARVCARRPDTGAAR